MDLSSVRIRRERKTVGRFLAENACLWHKADMLNALTEFLFRNLIHQCYCSDSHNWQCRKRSALPNPPHIEAGECDGLVL
jgi:hypothetical protein